MAIGGTRQPSSPVAPLFTAGGTLRRQPRQHLPHLVVTIHGQATAIPAARRHCTAEFTSAMCQQPDARQSRSQFPAGMLVMLHRTGVHSPSSGTYTTAGTGPPSRYLDVQVNQGSLGCTRSKVLSSCMQDRLHVGRPDGALALIPSGGLLRDSGDTGPTQPVCSETEGRPMVRPLIYCLFSWKQRAPSAAKAAQCPAVKCESPADKSPGRTSLSFPV